MIVRSSLSLSSWMFLASRSKSIRLLTALNYFSMPLSEHFKTVSLTEVCNLYTNYSISYIFLLYLWWLDGLRSTDLICYLILRFKAAAFNFECYQLIVLRYFFVSSVGVFLEFQLHQLPCLTSKSSLSAICQKMSVNILIKYWRNCYRSRASIWKSIFFLWSYNIQFLL